MTTTAPRSRSRSSSMTSPTPNAPKARGAAGRPEHEDVTAGTDADRRELLMAAARRLVTPEDPTALSYVLAGLVHVELPARQGLLEAMDTEARRRGAGRGGAAPARGPVGEQRRYAPPATSLSASSEQRGCLTPPPPPGGRPPARFRAPFARRGRA